MTLQMEPPYKFGVRRPKNKEYEQIDDLVEEWKIHHVQKYPDTFQLDYEHGTEACVKYGCNCTPLSECEKLDEDQTIEGKNRRNKGLSIREKEIVSRLRKLEFDDFWENF